MSFLNTIELRPKEFIDLDPAEFLRRFEKKRRKFSNFRIIAPKIGSSGFGKIRAKLKVPIYCVEVQDE
ncbi:MAG: hypothetical protein NTX50_26695 [Candidatus Sumerlaeota bacterium]|nr:hypothetical protein [Candidatus Sumerlaeota bacterium]